MWHTLCTDIVYSMLTKNTDFKIKLFQYQERKILKFYWPYKTHPHQNTASIKPKVTILKMAYLIKKTCYEIWCFVYFWNDPQAKFFLFSNTVIQCVSISEKDV